MIVSNWSQTASFKPTHVLSPCTEDELCDILAEARSAGRTLKVMGARHSPGDIFSTEGACVDLTGLRRILSFAPDKRLIEVEAGTRLSAINDYLRTRGFALANLGSISDQTISGAISTGTHGTGLGFGALHEQVSGFDVLLASGERRTVDAHNTPEWFHAFKLGLGALGIIVRVRLSVVPLFALDTTVENCTLDEALRDLVDDARRHDHFKLLVYPHTARAKKWIARRMPPEGPLTHDGSTGLAEKLVQGHLLQALLWASRGSVLATKLLNRAYYWLSNHKTLSYRGLSHHVFNFDCLFRQHVNEWAIALEDAPRAVRELDRLITTNRWQADFPIEVRFSRRDDTWLSPAYERDTCHIGVIMYRPYGRERDHGAYWSAYESLMRSLGGRPHWAKAFGADEAYLNTVYPQLHRFLALRTKLDPLGMFMNNYLRRHFGDTLREPAVSKPETRSNAWIS
jgi:L-gulonolactone oxidase